MIPPDAPGGQCPTCLLILAIEADGETETFEAADPGPAETIGPYRLLSELGRGGMGLVFLAEQVAPVRRLVALKVIKPGIDSKPVLARIESERQALALLQHPGIAAICDAGVLQRHDPRLEYAAEERAPLRSGAMTRSTRGALLPLDQ